jgi:NAD(P)-dependent dehydrogenase (short-subunit alcohol dehydrogenase family)
MTGLALVTGGAKGIGQAITRALARAGYEVIITGRDEAALQAEVAELADRGSTAHARKMDVSRAGSVASVFDDVEATIGPLDVLVNCAGVIIRGDAETLPDDDWLQVIDTDLNGAFWCSRAAARGMLAQGRGVIVNVGSVASSTGISGRVSYTTAKAGLSGMTRTLAVEWAKRGIRVNSIAPGWTSRVSTKAVSTKRPSSDVFRWVDWHTPTRSRRSCCSWRRTRRPTSPGRSSPSTVASP